MWKAIAAVAVGAGCGGVMRWMLSLRLNAVWPNMPLGTLVSNLVAGYIVGVAVAVFAQMPNLSPEWRLVIITGFCGGLSTFSTFSIEVVTALERGAYSWALGMVSVHVLGSLLMTIAGLATVWWLKSVW
ncbi:fluoride efflux transporter CrcB [Paenalcaligenes suwonensis]|uniref:fluoride efflux transporter CrcB n=1 Tax=Paenalcaligenes suwonensis TaxID=1202713 RepID=UPI001409D635|nr:fluoride efflux transporter CrcB [Paenalcaligenes suwonensis]NHC60271.1 fluoride efflux transporter CrcB [Paenalcaligenes suwonensis]